MKMCGTSCAYKGVLVCVCAFRFVCVRVYMSVCVFGFMWLCLCIGMQTHACMCSGGSSSSHAFSISKSTRCTLGIRFEERTKN